MSQATPSATPVRNADGQKKGKKLPLIVDVAIGNNGKQLYQVHESSKMVRKEMPRSTNFALNDDISDEGFFISQINEQRTPIRKTLGTLSPSSLNQKRIRHDVYDQGDDNSNDDNCQNDVYEQQQQQPQQQQQQQQLHQPNMYENGNVGVISNDPVSAVGHYDNNPVSHVPTGAYSRVQDTDIWSDDVEEAFEEVLRLIPKSGLNKIKIAGRSCGRNELISDYIFAKTGKFRTRKQVSSHIQVIKNLGQKLDIIQLINDGPIFNSHEEQLESTKKFEDVFSKINLNKSLGFSDSMKRKSDSMPMHLPATKRIRRKHSGNPLNKIKFSNFFMSVNDQYGMNPIVLTIQQNGNDVKSLKLKDNANISSRFPGLSDFKSCPHIPIIHNMVKILLPQLPESYSIDDGFSSSYALKYEEPENASPTHTSIISSSRTYSLFTCVYSYGKEIVKFDEDGIQLNQDREFIPGFWKFFFSTFGDQSEGGLSAAFKGVTIKQILYESSPDSVKKEQDASKVNKLKVKLVLLWEFAKVSECKDALTTTTKLVLPPRALASSSKTTEEVFEYSEPALNSIGGTPTDTTSPNMDLNNQNLSGAATSIPGIRDTIHSASMPDINELPSSAKPQVRLQKTFQSMQHLQPHQMWQQQQQQQQPLQGAYTSSVASQLLNTSLSSPYAQYGMPLPQQTIGTFAPPTSQTFGVSYTHNSQHPSANMDLMMLSSMNTGYGNITNNQDYQFGNIGYTEGFTSEF